MGLARFHLPKLEEGALSGDEAKHCLQVLRRQVGDTISVFDGRGTEAIAEITSISSKRVELKLAEKRSTPAPAVSLSLLQAIPKGSNMELIIEKAVELGVNAIFPMMTERTVVRLGVAEAKKKQEKWQRLALETCKQCGQNWLPEVHMPRPFSEVLTALPPYDVRIIAALLPDSQSAKTILSGVSSPHSAVLAVGPEGDFSPAEYAAARAAGFVPMSLGALILRVETATLYALSVLSHELRGDSAARPIFHYTGDSPK
jgi:16S rRNA (uracil1498-N3)-methyltransferase